MVKLLVCGPVTADSAETLSLRAQQLQTSAAGPFDLLLLLSAHSPHMSLGLPTHCFSTASISDSPTSTTPFPNSMGTLTLQGLTIAYCFDSSVLPSDERFIALVGLASAPGWRGCDLLLTLDWPFDAHQFLPPIEYAAFAALGLGAGIGFKSISSLALALSPRYHFASGAAFYARPAYSNASLETPVPQTRFISLCAVSASKEKQLKWMHALSLEPLASMADEEIVRGNASNAALCTDNPYTSAQHTRSAAEAPAPKKGRFDALDERTPRQSMFFDVAAPGGARAGAPIVPTASSLTLFVGGFPPKCSEAEIRSIFESCKCTSVSKQDGKSFAFVSFDSHASAVAVLGAADSFGYRGRALTMNWAKGRSDTEAHPLTSAPSSDHKLVFFGGVPHVATTKDILDVLDIVVQDKDVTSVRRPEGKTFLFIEFSSYAIASKVIELSAKGLKIFDATVFVGWGKSNGPESESNECWFCLSSSTIKTHLICSVAEEAYLAVPRGGMHESHVLIVPIQCVSSRLQLNQNAIADIDRYKSSLAKMFDSTGLSYVAFERCVRNNRGKDHLQVHLIPVPLERVRNAVHTFKQLSQQHGIQFAELSGAESDLSSVLLGESEAAGRAVAQYFYLDLPEEAEEGKIIRRRFLFIDYEGIRIPLQFGLEVAANVLGDPSKAHWKNCMVSDEEEQRIADQFREVFGPYDFTL